jgi:sugar lactone lactonase YvrE
MFTVLLLVAVPTTAATDPASVYTRRPVDAAAYYFSGERYGDGSTDATAALQEAINKLKSERNYGILFIPEGRYLISNPLHVPPAIRLIGYGTRRPEFILGGSTPGYQDADAENYILWFTGRMVEGDARPSDANPGTFYSAVSNIDFRIGDGNAGAVALRTHYAQHGFVSHSVIHIGSGKAGISQVGNEIENVEFRGGAYGILTGPTSPSWPMMMVDTHFEGQRRAAIRSHNSGLTMVNLHARNVPVVFEIEEEATDRLFLEQGLLENVRDAAIVINSRESALTQINILDTYARNVPVFARFRGPADDVKGAGDAYLVREFTHGLVVRNLASDSKFETIVDFVRQSDFAISDRMPSALERNVPALPPTEEWVSVKNFGATGDGETDDTAAIRRAIMGNRVVYFPQGWYRVTDTITMEPDTRLVGLHPWATQLIIHDSEPAFSGFGGPKPVLQSSEGGDGVLNGIGISTGAYNYRAVGLKWMAGAESLVNDVKFVGGHGTMLPPGMPRRFQPRRGISKPEEPVYDRGMDQAWDNQFWSLWVTNRGGGTFKDIWTANTYATSGMLVSNTTTPGRIYAMSIEHHVRGEVRFDGVENWKMYAFQFEEEYIEGVESQMIEVVDSRNLAFNSLWMYRTIRVQTPKRFGMRLWNVHDIEIRNLHNYTQKLWVTEFPVWDVNRELPVYAWELARMTVTGLEPAARSTDLTVGSLNRLASGFDFAQGLAADAEGNVFFCESRRRRIYKWSVDTGAVTMLADFPFEPFALGTDSGGRLLVVARYEPQPGYLIGGEQETVKRLPDDNPAYSSWGNSGWTAIPYSIDPHSPGSTFEPMARVATAEIEQLDKMYYPSSRWHYTFDEAAVYYPDSAFVAPDGRTFIAETYDIGRTSTLAAAVPGQTIFASDDIAKRTVRMDVEKNGRLTNLTEVLPRGETSHAVDRAGNVYVADGQIFVYDADLNETRRINIPERPISLAMGGAEGDILFITTVNSLYALRVR